MAVNYNDKRFKTVEKEKKVALNENEKMYSGMINNSDKYFNDQINASKDWAKKQTKFQQQQTDFAIEKINQDKEQAKKDYIKEQSGAYVDWQKQSNPYSANSEQMASMGMLGAGYSESSQVSMYNTYQNRVATARESYNQAILNYNNSIKEARLKNNSILAEIAYNALQKQLELSLQGFQYKNQLIIDKANKKTEIENNYYNRYLSVVDQINKENEFAEQQRQYNETLAFNKKTHAEEMALKKQQAADNKKLQQAQLQLQRDQFNLEKSQASKPSSGSSSGSEKSSGSTSIKKESSKQTSFKTYSEAAAYMKKQGVATGDGGLMTKNEWLRRKRSGSNRAETAYSSYEAYLSNFVAYRMANPQ